MFRQEVDAAVDALLMQQVALVPTPGGWALACDAELTRAVARLRALASPVAAAAPEQRLAPAAPVAGAAPADDFTHALTRRLGHPVLLVVVAPTYGEVPAELLRAADYVVNWGR